MELSEKRCGGKKGLNRKKETWVVFPKAQTCVGKRTAEDGGADAAKAFTTGQ